MTLTPATSRNNGLPIGLTGATQATRYVGGTATVAPTTGTFAVGDYVIGQNGTLFVCTLAGTPGTWAQVGSSGSTGMGWYSGNGQSVNNGVQASLNFDNHDGGSALLNISVPALPTFVADGLYACTFWLGPQNALTAAGSYVVEVDISSGGGVAAGAASAPSTTQVSEPSVVVPLTVKAAAGDSVAVKLQNLDGTLARFFGIFVGTITKLG